ncbi:uncharacterized protein LOC129918410 [Episyrphus balteatus]|uniref:uncharacterized protein LOC129918410 n=1 Tax=Episyrphus balteatus TaxID=286459 RepID=UPI002485D2CD|nr:uncharacterized protein LOC129918410 [Episyrphus balteatus]XP_055854897.1 uncharacterized protein LOC129918410 [Episyrphus balteatus]
MDESQSRSTSPVEKNTISELKQTETPVNIIPQTETPVNIIPSSQVLLSTTNYVLVRDDSKLLLNDLSSPDNKSISIQEQSDDQSGVENVSFTELISSYCSNDDDNEVEALKTLLNEWKIPNMFHQLFIDENLFVPVLQVANEFFMKRFLQTLNITTASRIVFFDKWFQWKTERYTSLSNTPSLVSTPTTSVASPSSTTASVSKSLIDILNCKDGQTIKDYYDENKNIDNKSVRKLLTDTILSYARINNVHFSSNDLIKLSDEIQLVFNEDPLDYYCTKKGMKNPKGMLANKFHNYRGKSRSINRLFADHNNKEKKIDDLPVEPNTFEQEKLLLKMKHDHHTMNAQEKSDAWAKTFNIRQLDLKKANDKTIKWEKFYEKWHFMNFPNGYEYIESDFNRMFANKDDVLVGTKIAHFCNLMLQYAFPKLITNIELKNMLHDFNQQCQADVCEVTQSNYN